MLLEATLLSSCPLLILRRFVDVHEGHRELVILLKFVEGFHEQIFFLLVRLDHYFDVLRVASVLHDL